MSIVNAVAKLDASNHATLMDKTLTRYSLPDPRK